MEQQLIWKQFFRVRARSVYLEKLLRSDEKIDWRINVVLAITSSSSIAGWAVWKEFAWAWGAAIALSQLFNALLPLFPYKERIKCLSALGRDLRQLGITIEGKWLDIAAGEVSIKDMRKFYGEFLRMEVELEEKYFHGKTIPEDTQLFEVAENEVIQSLSPYFVGDNNGDQENPS